jgi:hypothetical protein
VTRPNFEIGVALRARRLVAHVPPDTRTDTSSDDASLERQEMRRGLPADFAPGRRYDDVAVEKRVVGTWSGWCGERWRAGRVARHALSRQKAGG